MSLMFSKVIKSNCRERIKDSIKKYDKKTKINFIPYSLDDMTFINCPLNSRNTKGNIVGTALYNDYLLNKFYKKEIIKDEIYKSIKKELEVLDKTLYVDEKLYANFYEDFEIINMNDKLKLITIEVIQFNKEKIEDERLLMSAIIFFHFIKGIKEISFLLYDYSKSDIVEINITRNKDTITTNSFELNFSENDINSLDIEEITSKLVINSHMKDKSVLCNLCLYNENCKMEK